MSREVTEALLDKIDELSDDKVLLMKKNEELEAEVERLRDILDIVGGAER